MIEKILYTNKTIIAIKITDIGEKNNNAIAIIKDCVKEPIILNKGSTKPCETAKLEVVNKVTNSSS